MSADSVARAASSSWAESPVNSMIWVSPSQSASSLFGRYSSRTVWKFEPPKPKALTAARRGAPEESQGRFSVGR